MGNKAKNLRIIRSLFDFPVPPFITNHESKGIYGEGPITLLDYRDYEFDDLDTLYKNVKQYFYLKNYDGNISIRSSGESSMPGLLKTMLNVDLLDKDTFIWSYQAVLNSFNSPLVRAYRKRYNLPDEECPTIIFQQMVDGTGENSCSGIFFTRNPMIGDNYPEVKFIKASSGDNIVNGKNSDKYFEKVFLEQYEQLVKIGKELEKLFGFPQDIEFTIENGRVWILQTRDIVFDKQAIYRVHAELIQEGVLLKDEVKKKLPYPNKKDFEYVVGGITSLWGEGVSSGIVTGKLVSKPTVEPYILLSNQLMMDEGVDYSNCLGIVSRIGNNLCHAAVIARKFGIPCVIFKLPSIEEYLNEEISIDGSTGKIYGDRVDIEISKNWKEVEYIFG